MIDLAVITPPETFPALAPESAFPERNRLVAELRVTQPGPYCASPGVGDDEKYCRGCNQIKPLDDFWRDRWTADGRCARCRECCTVKRSPAKVRIIQAPHAPATIISIEPARKTWRERIEARRAAAS